MSKAPAVTKPKTTKAVVEKPARADPPPTSSPDSSIPKGVISHDKVQKHNRGEIVQMEYYLSMLRAPYSVDALKLFHRIIND